MITNKTHIKINVHTIGEIEPKNVPRAAPTLNLKVTMDKHQVAQLFLDSLDDFTLDELIPLINDYLQEYEIIVTEKKKYHFFWDGIFSNWYLTEFEVDGITFNCGEQYMMYIKSVFFKDDYTAFKILQETKPNRQKELGRQVKNFNNGEWDMVKYDLVKKGLREKFNRNNKLKEYLLKHKGYIIVEASPEDRIWGIGFSEDEALINFDKWGENLLGKILTELANEL